MTTMTSPEQFTLQSQNLGCLPIVNFFLNRIGLADHLRNYLPAGDARLRLTPAAVVEVVVANLVAGHRPVYALGEWAAAFDPGVLGLAVGDAEALNDDRVGRTLDRLFDADRASLITATVLAVIRDFDVETTQLHNDSTTVTVTGAYPDADGRDRGGKATPAIRHGHNKDYRPDLKQLLFILTISADGAVPIAYRVADGNTPDDVTHIPTWDQLRALVGSAGFLYVADSKLCSKQAMGHIASHGGRFVTIVPHGRREDTWFRDWAQTHAPAWIEARRGPGAQTRYRRTEKTVFTITAPIAADKVAYDALTDGCFPTITNDTVMTGAEVLAAYHYQPNLERRNHLLKGPQEVAPVYLETAHRIEALLLCHFLAMLTEALIEREIRTSMSNQGLAGIPLYPELRNCPAPSAPRILEIFDDIQRHQLIDNGQIVQTFEPELTDLQQQVLDLLHIPASVYSSTETR